MDWLWNKKPVMPKEYDEPSTKEGRFQSALTKNAIMNTAAERKGRVYGDIYLESPSERQRKSTAAIRGLPDAGKQMKPR
mgnify:FL=1